MSIAADTLTGAWVSGWQPDPVLTIAQWADKNVVLSTKSSAEAGNYRTSRTPYVIEILEALSPSSPVQRVAWIAGAQIGKTQCMLNWIGAVIDQFPGPMLMVQPTVDMARKVSKQRIGPMIESTAVLKAKVATTKSKDSSNTLFEKEFAGGMLMLTGANSASGLRSMPIRYLACDETDAYPLDVDGEGSPLSLAEKRTTTFSRRKVFLTSTPTIKGLSAIEREFERSDKRYYHVPCPHCGDMHILKWPNMVWDEGQPTTARMVCRACGCLIDETHKTQMLEAGEWRPTAVGDGTRGYHLSALYSPAGWKKWGDCVAEFIDAKDSTEQLKVWVNTVLAETWEDKGEGVDPQTLKARLEEYEHEVPAGVKYLVCAVDVQDTWLEATVVGYGEREESWLIAHTQIQGDPGGDEVWEELDELRLTNYKTATGTMRIDTTLVDSGGHFSNSVYKYCKARPGQRVWALKGLQHPGKAIVSNPSTNNAFRVKLWIIGTDAAKDLIVSRMKIKRPGPGYMHLPSWVDDEYLAQLTSEKAVRKYIPGRGSVRVWVNTRKRNEAFDLTVYALAALYTRGISFLNRLNRRKATDATEPAPDTSTDDGAGDEATDNLPGTATGSHQPATTPPPLPTYTRKPTQQAKPAAPPAYKWGTGPAVPGRSKWGN